MMIDSKTMVSMTEANQNFSRVAKLVDELGSAVIMKNNVPRYLVTEFPQEDRMETCSDADILAASNEVIAKNLQAYEVLAK